MLRHRATIRTFAAGFATAAALAQQPALAATWDIIVPPRMPDSAALKAEIWDFFLHGLAPGESFALYDGMDGREMLRIAIPNDRRFDEERVRTKTFGRETAQLSRAIDALSDPDNSAIPYRIDFPGRAYEFAQSRTGGESQLLVVTSGMHLSDLEPSFSVRLVGSELFLPTDAHIEAPLSESPYGTMGLRTALDGVVVHVCLQSDEDPLTTYQKDELRRFWSLYVHWLGGELSTFTESLSGCFDRWRDKVSGRMPEEALDISSDVLEMRRVKRTPLEDLEETAASGRLPEGVETFSLFASRPHPALPGFDVTTGTQYRTDEHPRYLNAWCYTMIENNGASLRVEIGTKLPYKDVEWSDIPTGTLRAAAISREQAEAGRRACQFPSDAT
jgi:hypothetical protein